MLVDLVQTTARDGVRLDGIYQAPERSGSPAWPDGVVFVHGTGGNFYSSVMFDVLAEGFLARGIGVLRGNTRGHDLMCNVATARGGKRLGAAYEVVDDCRHDMAAWVGWLAAKAGPRIGLVGHSMGAVKCLYMCAHEPEVAVACVIAISPPRLSHRWFLGGEKAREFRETYERASALVSAREPETLIEVQLPLPMVISAGGYVEKYGPDERYNYLRFLNKVSCPVLLSLGEQEVAKNVAFQGVSEEIAKVASGVRVETVPGADHFYTSARDELLRRIEAWLEEKTERPSP